MTDRPVKKIMKLENRLREWRQARRAALLIVVAMTLALVPLSALIVSWTFTTIIGQPLSFKEALVIGVIVAIPLFIFMPNAISGARPTAEDVREDQALRRAAGLPDDVED